MPYVRFAREEPDGIGLFLRGVLRRYVDSVLLDPYANSFWRVWHDPRHLSFDDRELLGRGRWTATHTSGVHWSPCQG